METLKGWQDERHQPIERKRKGTEGEGNRQVNKGNEKDRPKKKEQREMLKGRQREKDINQ